MCSTLRFSHPTARPEAPSSNASNTRIGQAKVVCSFFLPHLPRSKNFRDRKRQYAVQTHIRNDDFLILRVQRDRKSTRLNSSHITISYAVFCLKKKTPEASCLSAENLHHYQYLVTFGR